MTQCKCFMCRLSDHALDKLMAQATGLPLARVSAINDQIGTALNLADDPDAVLAALQAECPDVEPIIALWNAWFTDATMTGHASGLQ